MKSGAKPVVVDSARAYDAYAGRYDSLLSENRINAYMRSAMTSFEQETFQPGQRLLEVGCGTGDEAVALASRGCNVVGTDPSKEMIRVARGKAEALHLERRLTFFVGYARDLERALASEADASFDGSYSSFALSYENDLASVRNALRRLLRPGGILLASVMNRMSGLEWALALGSLHPALAGRRLRPRTLHKVGVVETTVYCRTPEQLRRALSPGFRLERLRGLPVMLPPHYVNRPLLRWPSLVSALGKLDARVAGWPVLRDLGDHNVVWFRRSE